MTARAFIELHSTEGWEDPLYIATDLIEGVMPIVDGTFREKVTSKVILTDRPPVTVNERPRDVMDRLREAVS